ncbi:hypothetical protein Tco_0090321 [Tanacetum coccineum]
MARRGLPKIMGILKSSIISSMTKSTWKMNLYIFISRFFITPLRILFVLSAISITMFIGSSFPIPKRLYIENGIMLMLAPKSAKVLLKSNLPIEQGRMKQHGSSSLGGSPSFHEPKLLRRVALDKDPETPFLVGRGFIATANAVIDCRMAKIAVGEGITRKDFLDCHLPEEWEISRDVELNPFKDTLVFRRMDKPPKNRDGAWHAKIRLIDPDGRNLPKPFNQFPLLGSSPKEKVQERSSTWTTSTTLDV